MAPAARLRIGLFGNTGNTLYQVAKALRRHTGHDVHLYVDPRHHRTMLPESDDPSLRGGYPEWIHRGDLLGPRRYLAPWISPVVRELARHDLVIAAGEGPIFAQFSGRPWCFFVTGGDLTLLPFPRRFWFRHRGARAKAASLLLAYWQRRAIGRATEIWSQPFRPFSLALDRLGVDPGRVAPEYFPLALDAERFRPQTLAEVSDPTALALRRAHDFILFHPSRLMISAQRALRDAGQWKRNDLLLRAWARVVRAGVGERPALVLLERTANSDAVIAREIAASLGLGDTLVWLRAPRAEGFTRDELIAYYAVSDVVADDFGAGWFGSVALEALALARPLVTYVDEAAMALLYPWHPMLSVGNEEDVVAILIRLAREPGWRADVGRRGRAWIEEFHTDAATGAHYARNIATVAERLGLS